MHTSRLRNSYSLAEKILIVLISFMLFDYNATGQYFGYIVFVYVMVFFNLNRYFFNSFFKLLLLFSLINGIISISNFGLTTGIGEISRLIFIPIAMFFSGMILAREKAIMLIMRTIVVFIVIYSFRAMVSVLIDIYENGFVSGRNIEIWASAVGSEMNATNIFSLIVLNLSGLILIFITPENIKERLLKYFLIFVGVLSFLITLKVGSRTGIVVLLLTFMALFIITYKKNKVGFLFVMILLLLLFGVFFTFNSNTHLLDSDYMSAYQDRVESTEFGANTAGGRLFIWQYYISQIPTHLFGNIPDFEGIIEAKFAHNIFLDVARKTGAIPMLIMLILSVLSIKIIIKNIKVTKNNSYYFSYTVGIVIGCWSVFLVEPVFDGMYMLYFLYTLIIGTAYSLNIQYNNSL